MSPRLCHFLGKLYAIEQRIRARSLASRRVAGRRLDDEHAAPPHEHCAPLTRTPLPPGRISCPRRTNIVPPMNEHRVPFTRIICPRMHLILASVSGFSRGDKYKLLLICKPHPTTSTGDPATTLQCLEFFCCCFLRTDSQATSPEKPRTVVYRSSSRLSALPATTNLFSEPTNNLPTLANTGSTVAKPPSRCRPIRARAPGRKPRVQSSVRRQPPSPIGGLLGVRLN